MVWQAERVPSDFPQGWVLERIPRSSRKLPLPMLGAESKAGMATPRKVRQAATELEPGSELREVEAGTSEPS